MLSQPFRHDDIVFKDRVVRRPGTAPLAEGAGPPAAVTATVLRRPLNIITRAQPVQTAQMAKNPHRTRI